MHRLITVDAMNTLFKVRGSVGLLYSEAALQHGHKLSPDFLEAEFKKVFKCHYSKYPNFGATNGVSTQEWWLEVVRETFQGVYSTLDKQTIEAISSRLYDEFSKASSWEVFPEVPQVLNHLRENKYMLGVISNFDERLCTILERLQLMEYFSFVICSSEVKVCKPSSDIFEFALKMGNVSAKDVLHIGDNLELDYEAATSLGISALLLNRGDTGSAKDIGGRVKSNHIIADLKPLLDL